MNSATIELMKNHSSVRRFTAEAIEKEVLEELISAGQSASSSSFIQAYSIVRVTDKTVRAQISEAAGGQPWVNSAAEFLVFCADLKRIEIACTQYDLGKLEGHTEHFLAASVDVSLVAQNVLLAAESIGLGGVFIGGIRNEPQLLSDLLRLPDQIYPVFGMCLGYPAKVAEVKPRFSVKSILHEEYYQVDRVDDDVAAYDKEMRTYYESRNTNKRLSNWSEQTAKAVQLKKREHFLSFLQNRGLLKR